jgi:hypothetical protein
MRVDRLRRRLRPPRTSQNSCQNKNQELLESHMIFLCVSIIADTVIIKKMVEQAQIDESTGDFS